MNHYNLGNWMLAFSGVGYSLIGVGMTLPIGNQSLPVFIGMFVIAIAMVFAHVDHSFRPIRVVESTMLRQNKIFFTAALLMVVLGIPGMLISVSFDIDYALRNLAALARLFFFLALALFTASIARTCNNLRIDKWLVFGCIGACTLNFLDYFSGQSLTKSLAGQNPLGFIVSVLFPFAVMYFFESHFLKKVMWAVVVMLMVVSAFLTWSKGAWINIAFVFLLLLLLRFRRGAGWGAAVALIVLSIFAVQQYHDIIERIVTTEISASEGSSSNEMRIAQIKNGIEIGLAYPLGIGNATYPIVSERLGLYFPQMTPPDPHNAYIQVLTGFGLFGFIFYIALLLYVLVKVLSSRRKIPTLDFQVYLLVLVSLFFQGMLSGELFTQPIAWALFGLVLGKVSPIRTMGTSVTT